MEEKMGKLGVGLGLVILQQINPNYSTAQNS